MNFKKGDIPWNYKDITGQKFERLTVIKRVYPKIGHKKCTMWLCKCDCGNMKVVDGRHLKNGNTKSCGCLIREITSERSKISFGLANIRRRMDTYKRGAKKRNLEWNLTEEQFKEITEKECFYCGAKPKKQYYKPKYQNGDRACNGIDRIDNTKGYIIDNVVPCCYKCNSAKGKLTLEEFKDLIKKIYNKMFM